MCEADRVRVVDSLLFIEFQRITLGFCSDQCVGDVKELLAKEYCALEARYMLQHKYSQNALRRFHQHFRFAFPNNRRFSHSSVLPIQHVMRSFSQTLFSYFLSSLLYILGYPPLLLCAVGSLTSFIFRGDYPYWFVGLRIFLELVDEVIKFLLFLLSILQRSLLEFWIVFLLHVRTYLLDLAIQTTCLKQFLFGRRYPVDEGWTSNGQDDAPRKGYVLNPVMSTNGLLTQKAS